MRVVKTIRKQLELANMGRLYYINDRYGYNRATEQDVLAGVHKFYGK